MAALQAQNNASARLPTFRAQSELVTVPVVVTNKSGAHIEHLQKEDFTLLEDGETRPIATFEEVQKPAGPRFRTPAQSIEFSNQVSPEAGPVHLTILVLDLVNTSFEDQASAKRQLLTFLAQSIDNSQPTSLLMVTRAEDSR